jgi:hypothetical protein
LGFSRAASAQTCLQDEFTAAGNHQHLNCTANDVSLAQAVNPRAPDGTPITTCFAGVPFSFIADFQVVTTATARENVAFYMATGGQGNALTGSCVDNIISPLHDPGTNTKSTCVTGGPGTQCLGSALYHEFDTSLAGDNCGDTTSADGTSQFVTISVNNILCPAVGTTFMLPNCTSWQQPGGANLCASSPPNTGWPWVLAAVPGSPSKCSCGALAIPITPISYLMTASKTPNPTSRQEPGGDFVYTVGVSNATTTGGAASSEIIDQICDDRFGNIATVNTCSGGTNHGLSCNTSADCGGGTCVVPPACPAGNLCAAGSQPGSTCAKNISCTLPQTIASGASNNSLCSFTGTYSPGTEGSLKDTVTVNGFGNTGATSPPAVTASANATVTVSEAPASVSVSKTLDSGHACAIVRYKVEVDNTSNTSTDESEVLSVLNDMPGFGDVTKLSSIVLGTTCGQPLPVNGAPGGIGTLSGSNGAGPLSATIQPGGSYVCKFDGEFCGALGTAGTTCTSGLENTDTMNATVTDDNSEGHPVTGSTQSTLTVDVCFTHTP